ncbi:MULTISPECIES: PDR/VanB family oxidoreductase [Pseudomonas]|jgi:vanillate O-demethylase ferredoxin subunit|uniref:PDR/VanB family oxidoreductase n=1 Tax=Pseudomonas TaxID=286 RepID=UPI001259E123|nr:MULTISPECIES: PDR/VanB family oxidoreductase [Pseudomonas]VVM80155.1 Carnitine monooxygenase reductase subunit [Pseudomonas fluorescens]
MTRLKVKVTEMAAQGASNISIRLEPIYGQTLPGFEAGAHVDVFLANGLIRQYSIASAPFMDDHYELCVKLDSASRGGSRFVHEHLAVGDELEISLPRNLFALQPARHYILIAAGIGITPLISMAAELDRKQLSFSLHYYTRTLADVAFGERLASYLGTSQVHLHQSYAGRSPRQYLPEDLQRPSAEQLVYLCGPAEFMVHVEQSAKLSGWAPERIIKEAFSPTAVIADVGADTFEIELKSTGAVYTVHGEQSIARVLLDAGVDVPVSCEQGMCGACLTGVLSGEPEHLDMVMTDEEHALNNRMTLCCSRSRSDRLVLDL